MLLFNIIDRIDQWFDLFVLTLDCFFPPFFFDLWICQRMVFIVGLGSRWFGIQGPGYTVQGFQSLRKKGNPGIQTTGPQTNTPWKFNIAPENIPSKKERIVFQQAFFRGYVKLRGCSWICLRSSSYFLAQLHLLIVPPCQQPWEKMRQWHRFCFSASGRVVKQVLIMFSRNLT